MIQITFLFCILTLFLWGKLFATGNQKRPAWREDRWQTPRNGFVWLGLVFLSCQPIQAETVAVEDVNVVDRVVFKAFRQKENLSEPLGPAWAEEVSRDITALGGNTLLALFACIAAGLLCAVGYKKVAIRFWFLLAVGWAASTLLKMAFDRPRPALQGDVTHIASTSFPSGHAIMSVVFYVPLALIALSFCSKKAVKNVIITGVMFIIFVSGVTRIHLGVHWPTDIPAGWIVGGLIAWPGWLFTLKPLLGSHEPNR